MANLVSIANPEITKWEGFWYGELPSQEDKQTKLNNRHSAITCCRQLDGKHTGVFSDSKQNTDS